jgi:hypothetical protein
VGCGCSIVVHACAIAWVASADRCIPGEGGEGGLTAQPITLIEATTMAGREEPIFGPRWTGAVVGAALEPRRAAGITRATVLVSASAPEVREEPAAADARVDTDDPWDSVAAGTSGEVAANQDGAQDGASAEELRPVRLYDPFPNLPTSDVDVTVQVCVSGQGAVSDARIDGGAPEPSRNALRRAILSWRYRPLEIKGVQTAFCHRMRITYGTH